MMIDVLLVLLLVFWAFSNGFIMGHDESRKDFFEDAGATLPGRIFYFPVTILAAYDAKKIK